MRWLILALLLPNAAAHPMLVGVAPDLPGGVEGFAVGSDGPWDLSGWTVGDGEGTVALPDVHLAAGEALWLASNATAWLGLQGFAPVRGYQPGRLHLSDAGESLMLIDPGGREMDDFAWGDGKADAMAETVNRTSSGLVYVRDAAWPDTDSASDWRTPRMHRIGESHLAAATFTVHWLTLYSSPDSSHEVLAGLVAGARQRLHLHVYELGSLDLAHAMAEARRASPALDLQVLVDSSPVGFTAPQRHRETQALLDVQGAGGTTLLAGHGRYDDHHLKVLVADDAVAVQSENWVESGVPRDPSTGNRGWGVVVHDKAVADWFDAWMQGDRDAWDTRPFDLGFDPLFRAVPQTPPAAGLYGPVVPAVEVTGDFQVTPLVAPDMTQDPRHDPLAALVAAAHASVSVQELDLATGAANPLGWSSADPLLEALAAAAARGVTVRVQAAAPFSADDVGNGPALDWLSAHGVATEVLDRPGLTTLHNKGLAADGTVVVGSMNGNHHSRSANREVDLAVSGPGVAEWFQALFDSDWDGGRRGRDASVIATDIHALPGAPLPSLLALVGVATAVRSRRP
ncbi:MAG: phospholipase D-like domain-containing protein [Thermoplasmatota archaeon]